MIKDRKRFATFSGTVNESNKPAPMLIDDGEGMRHMPFSQWKKPSIACVNAWCSGLVAK